jgi:Thioesterase superfamily
VSAGGAGPDAESPGLNGAPLSAGDEPLNRLAAAMRRISAVAVGLPLPESEVVDAAARVTEVADALEAVAAPTRRDGSHPERGTHPQDFFPVSPLTGYANPIAPPVNVWAVQGEEDRLEIRGGVQFGYQYEGPPTCVHGGAIAALFDELLGMSNIVGGKAGMTGTLTVRYRKPTPLMAPLDLEGRVVRIEGRKVFTWGGIFHQGTLTAEAEGIFIEMRPTDMLGVVAANAARTEAPMVDAEFTRLIAERESGTE